MKGLFMKLISSNFNLKRLAFTKPKVAVYST